MINKNVANVLTDIAKIKKAKKDNRFSIGAYNKAAHFVIHSPQPIDQIDYHNVKGIGTKIAAHIDEFISTGKIQFREDNIDLLDASSKIDDLLRIEGVGEKTALHIYNTLKISTVDELKEAIDNGKINEVLKEKSIANILKGIDYIDKTRGRIRLDEGLDIAVKIYSYMKPYAKRIEAGGSIRRSTITVGDVDIAIVPLNNAKEVLEKFSQMPIVDDIIDIGDKKTSVWINGTRSDCYVFEEDNFEAGMQHLTGSATHNQKIRAIAKSKGLMLSQYGLKKGDKRIDNGTEEDIYHKLGFEFIPPEHRDGTTEFVDYKKGNQVPELLTEADVTADYHIHSRWSDGKHSIEDIVQFAIMQKFKTIAITDHSQSLKIAKGLTIEKLRERNQEIDRLQKKYPQIKILKGAEVDIKADGSLDYPDEILDELDIVLAAIHTKTSGDVTDRYLQVIQSGKINIVSHLIGRIINERKGHTLNIERILQACKDNNVALEFNCQPNRLDIDDSIMSRCKEHGIKVAIGSDAHSKEQLVYAKSFGVWISKRAKLTKENLYDL